MHNEEEERVFDRIDRIDKIDRKGKESQMISYDDFSECFSDRRQANGKPVWAQMELTFRCNLECIHCYIPRSPSCANPSSAAALLRRVEATEGRQGEGVPPTPRLRKAGRGKNQEELTFQEITDILDQIQQEGCLWLTLTGGEPLLRDDFLDIYSYAKKKGFLITLFTNGTLVSPEIADYLKQYPPFMIDITLNGITEKTYERITRIHGSFQKCLKGIHLLLERNLPLTLKSNGMKINKDEILKIKEYAQGLGAKFRYDSIIIPRLDGSKEPCQLRLSPEEIIEIETKDDAMREQWREWIESDHSLQSPNDLFRCGAGLFNINPYGKLQICHALRKASFDLRKASFKEGFYHFLSKIRSAKYQTDSKCKNCKIWYLCAQCPGRAELETGSQEAPVDFFCQLAHKRQEMKNVLAVQVQSDKGTEAQSKQ